MKTTWILRTMGLLILMVSLFALSSCSKKAEESLTKEQKEQQDKNVEATAIDEKTFTESDEDLTTVDYKEFYEQLAPHGEWVQVQPEEIGLKPKTAQLNSSGENDYSISGLMGIKNVFAETDANLGMVYVWKPSADLGVVQVVGEAPVYVPYSNGQWVNTDAGWYFKAPTPVEETVSHYGRWVNSPTAGWLWVPGRVWAPAWVNWKQNDGYVAWAPLPPSTYINDGIMSVPVIDDNNYVVVDRKYFLEPSVYKYNNIYYNNTNPVLLSDLTGTDGLVLVNNVLINRGPDVNVIQTIYGRNVDLVMIKHVKNLNDVRYSDREYSVYNWGFNRYYHKDNKRFNVNEPKHFKRYDEWKVVKNEEKQYRKEEKKIDKEFKKENKEYNKEYKKENKEYKKENKEYKKENKEYKKENNGNDNGKKNNGNDNGKKNNGNDNDNKHDSKDNSKGKK